MDKTPAAIPFQHGRGPAKCNLYESLICPLPVLHRAVYLFLIIQRVPLRAKSATASHSSELMRGCRYCRKNQD
jgi:hypothetical protein